MEEKDVAQFGKGAKHVLDERDFRLAAAIPAPFDWTNANDQEESGIVENQGSSLSCTGQTTAGMVGDREGRRASAHAVYCQTFLTDGGAYVRESLSIGSKQFVQNEDDFPSYPNDEENLRNLDGLVKKDREKDWAYASVPLTIDSIAVACRDQGSVSLAFYGSNPEWKTPDVKTQGRVWAHNVKAVRGVLRNGKKSIKFKNSWGPDWGNKGYGYADESAINQGGICAYVYTMQFAKVLKYILKNKKIADAPPNAKANPNFINALYWEASGRNATKKELALFVGRRVKDAANLILGKWRSPFFGV